MPTTKQEQWDWNKQQQQSTSSASSQQNAWQQLQVGGASPQEQMLRQLAMGIYGGMVGDINAQGWPTAQSVMNPYVTQQQAGFVNQAQQASLAAARQGMGTAFQDQTKLISGALANTGMLDSSAYPYALGTASRGLQDQYAQMAMQSQAQAAQQMMGLSQGNQQAGLNLMGMRQQAQQFASDPALLRQLTELRLALGKNVSGGTSSQSGQQTGTSSSEGYSKTKQTQPTNWMGLLGGLGSILGATTGMGGLFGGGSAPAQSMGYDYSAMQVPGQGGYDYSWMNQPVTPNYTAGAYSPGGYPANGPDMSWMYQSNMNQPVTPRAYGY